MGPDATGPAAFGLCNAYAKGGLNSASVAYASLVKAAGGASNITTYCATVTRPGRAASHVAAAAGTKPTRASGSERATKAAPAAVPTSALPSRAVAGMAHKPASVGRP